MDHGYGCKIQKIPLPLKLCYQVHSTNKTSRIAHCHIKLINTIIIPVTCSLSQDDRIRTTIWFCMIIIFTSINVRHHCILVCSSVFTTDGSLLYTQNKPFVLQTIYEVNNSQRLVYSQNLIFMVPKQLICLKPVFIQGNDRWCLPVVSIYNHKWH